MLYLTPNNYVEIDRIKFIINLNETSSFNQQLRRKIGNHNFEVNNVSEKRKRSLLLLNNKKAILCNVNTHTLSERIKSNEVKGLSKKFLDLSYNNYVQLNDILLITESKTEPISRIVSDLKEKNSLKLFNFTSTRKTKSVIFTVNNEVILSAIEASTLYKRANEAENLFQSVGHQGYINANHIHLIADRDEEHIKNKIKAVQDIDEKKVLRLSRKEAPRSAIFCTNNFIVLSKVNPETVAKNINLDN